VFGGFREKVILRIKSLENLLFYLLVLLTSTQLAIHYWPGFAFVFGVRIDYLSPTLYLTDVSLISIIALWFIQDIRKFWLTVIKYKWLLFAGVFFIFINTCFSVSAWPTLIKWLKLIELLLFGLYINTHLNSGKWITVTKLLLMSSAFFALIGITQVILGKTLGGVFYWLGERTFSINTPGISLVNLFGKEYLRMYSTFSHPNSLAGFMAVVFIIFVFNKSKRVWYEYLLLAIILIAILLTFSLSTFVGFGVCLLFYLLFNNYVFNQKSITAIIAGFFLISLMLPVISKNLLNNNLYFPQNIEQRLTLSVSSIQMFSTSPLIGKGLNTFTIFNNLLQPVHNIYLLTASEIGIIGLGILFLTLRLFTIKAVTNNRPEILLALIFIMITGLFDHYWLTLQQNLLLFTLIIGSVNKKI